MKGALKISIVVFIVIVLQSCTEPKPIYNSLADDDIRYAATFKNGSYWIYKDSVTGVEERVDVSGHNASYGGDNDPHDKSPVYWEFVGCSLHSNLEPVGVIVAYSASDPNSVTASIFKLPNSTVVTKPFVVGIFPKKYAGVVTEAIAYIPTMSVRDSVYTNVYHHRIFYTGKDSSILPPNIIDYYFSVDQGFVKVITKTDSSYTVKELVRYDVNK